MPRTTISIIEGKPSEFKESLFECIYTAMVETFDVPENDMFMTISEHKTENFCYGKSYLNIERTDELIMIEIICNNTRSVQQKQNLYKKIAENLHKKLNIRVEDIFINILECIKENWSFGYGIAQYA